MQAVERLEVGGYDEVYRVDCGGAVAFVALHAVLEGHAFGGIRIRSDPSLERGLQDALDLSRAMSRKVVLAGIRGGGGKSVLVLPGGSDAGSGGGQATEGTSGDRAGWVQRLGEFIQTLGGRYSCGPDMGFTAADDRVLRQATEHVACAGMSAATARGVFLCMQRVAGQPASVAVQGQGSIGRPLAEMLEDAGVKVVVSDLHPVEDFSSVQPEQIFDAEADVFAPCAMGGVLDEHTIPRLRGRTVCGGANNPFATLADVDRLHQRGIAYVPDVIASAGATVVGASTVLGEQALIEPRLLGLGDTAADVCRQAAEQGRSAHHVAMERADECIAELRAPGRD